MIKAAEEWEFCFVLPAAVGKESNNKLLLLLLYFNKLEFDTHTHSYYKKKSPLSFSF